jgi:hypothetical protein
MAVSDFKSSGNLEQEIAFQRISILADGWRENSLDQVQINDLMWLLVVWCTDEEAEDAVFSPADFGLSGPDLYAIYLAAE